MINLQIVSYEQSGKTALCAGLGKKLVSAGKKVGYVKPVHITSRSGREDCGDALFIREALELSEKDEQVCPLHISQEELWRNLSEDADNFSNKIKIACEVVSAGKDILIIESPGNLKNDQVSALACFTIAEKLNSRVIMLISYATDIRDKDILQAAGKFGDKLVGIVINQVPEARVGALQKDAGEYFKSQGMTVLGVLPESRTLGSVSINEVVSGIEGEIISFKDKADDLIENVMLGAMSPDSGRDYYNTKKNKAVITRSERTDMQLAALETSVRCLIVTGKKPNTSVMVKAEDKKIPIIMVNKDIKDIITGIEQIQGRAKFQNMQKLQAMSAILDSHFDYKAFYAAIGI